MKRGLRIGSIVGILLVVVLVVVIMGTIKTKDIKEYYNKEYSIKMNYPTNWNYYEKVPKPVTVSYELYNYSTNKYDNKFVKTNSNFIAVFSPTDNSLGPYTKDKQYVTIEIFNGTLNELFNQTYERSGWAKHDIETNGKYMTLGKFEKDFYGDEVVLDGGMAYKVVLEVQTFDTLYKSKVTEIKAEKEEGVIIIRLNNRDNNPEVEKIYNRMVSSFRFVDLVI